MGIKTGNIFTFEGKSALLLMHTTTSLFQNQVIIISCFVSQLFHESFSYIFPYNSIFICIESMSWKQTVNMTLSHPQYAHIFMQESQDHEYGRRKGVGLSLTNYLFSVYFSPAPSSLNHTLSLHLFLCFLFKMYKELFLKHDVL